MTYAFIRRAAAIAAASSLLATAASAAPDTWSFSQSYGPNGTITGTFIGEDFNSDGVITLLIDPLDNNNLLAGNELLGLSVTFAGPAFTGVFSQAQMVIGGIDNTISEFQYVVGSLNMDAILPGPPAKASVVTLATPLLTGATPEQDALVFWTAGSASFGALGNPDKGYLTIYTPSNPVSGILGDFATTSPVLISVAPPVPEPATYLMMAMGLGVLGSAARRRARALSGA